MVVKARARVCLAGLFTGLAAVASTDPGRAAVVARNKAVLASLTEVLSQVPWQDSTRDAITTAADASSQGQTAARSPGGPSGAEGKWDAAIAS